MPRLYQIIFVWTNDRHRSEFELISLTLRTKSKNKSYKLVKNNKKTYFCIWIRANFKLKRIIHCVEKMMRQIGSCPCVTIRGAVLSLSFRYSSHQALPPCVLFTNFIIHMAYRHTMRHHFGWCRNAWPSSGFSCHSVIIPPYSSQCNIITSQLWDLLNWKLY